MRFMPVCVRGLKLASDFLLLFLFLFYVMSCMCLCVCFGVDMHVSLHECIFLCLCVCVYRWTASLSEGDCISAGIHAPVPEAAYPEGKPVTLVSQTQPHTDNTHSEDTHSDNTYPVSCCCTLALPMCTCLLHVLPVNLIFIFYQIQGFASGS